jgi:hypothetical protein
LQTSRAACPRDTLDALLEVEMHRRRLGPIVGLVALLAVTAPRSTALANPSPSKLEGTWLVDLTFSDGFTLKALFTFMPGHTPGEGTLVDTNNFQFVPPACTPDQGVWERRGEREFVATHLTFCFNADTGLPDGTAKVRDRIELGRSGDRLAIRQFIEVFDNDGNPTGLTFEATGRGVRVKAEAPPRQ